MAQQYPIQQYGFQNAQVMVMDDIPDYDIQDYEIKVESKTYIIYDLEEGMRVRLGQKEAVLSSEDSNKLSQIIQETMR